MNALLDLGNSRFKAAISTAGSLRNASAEPYVPAGRVEAIIDWLRRQTPVERLIVSSVLGPGLDAQLDQACVLAGLPEPEYVATPAYGCGVRVGYARHEQLGVDRFLGLVAAKRHYRCPCVVVDCGTAVTIDALDTDGAHRGGLILPGLGLASRSLAVGTASVGASTPSENLRLFATSTQDAVHTGVRLGLAGAIDRVCTDMAAELVGDVTSILTGGDASTLQPLLRASYHHDAWLVLKGLAIVAEETPCAS